MGIGGIYWTRKMSGPPVMPMSTSPGSTEATTEASFYLAMTEWADLKWPNAAVPLMEMQMLTVWTPTGGNPSTSIQFFAECCSFSIFFFILEKLTLEGRRIMRFVTCITISSNPIGL